MAMFRRTSQYIVVASAAADLFIVDLNFSVAAGGSDYAKYAGTNCYAGHGGANIDNGNNHTTKPLAECEAFCDATPGCYCIVTSKSGGCFRRSTCAPESCELDGNYDTFLKPDAPPVPPTPTPPPTPKPYPDSRPLGPPCAAADCPNIVFSITDDQDYLLGGWENHGPTNPMRQTQQRIAAAGATLVNWRIHTPICSPSRSELVSGRYYHNIKSSLPVPVTDKIIYAGSGHIDSSHYVNQTFPVLLRERGYQVGLFGKGNFNTYEGFDRWFQGATLQYAANHWEDDEAPNGVYVQSKDEYPTALIGNKTVEWIERASVSGAATGRPFFAYFASHCPHFPATPAHWYADACKGTTSVRTPNFNHSNDGFHALVAEQPPLTDVDATLTDQLARSRCQCLLSVDDAHAAILDAVAGLNSARKTYFVFSSDYGYNLGGHRLTSEKMNLYEHSLRIPMVFMGPGIPAGLQLSHLGTNVDLAPTFLELAGVEPPPWMDGRSIVRALIPDAEHPAIRGTATTSLLRRLREQRQQAQATGVDDSDALAFRNESFFQFYNAGPWAPGNGGDICPVCTAATCSVPGNICPGLNCDIAAITTGDCTVRKLDDESNTYIGITTHPDASIGYWKLAEFQTDCSAVQLDPAAPHCFDDLTLTELFDLERDPHELTNVVDSAPPSVVQELRTRLRRFYPCKGRGCP